MQKRADLATHWQSSVLTLHDFLDHGWRSGSPASSVQLMKELHVEPLGARPPWDYPVRHFRKIRACDPSPTQKAWRRHLLLHCSSRAETAIANIFRDLDFPRFGTQRVERRPRVAMQLLHCPAAPWTIRQRQKLATKRPKRWKSASHSTSIRPRLRRTGETLNGGTPIRAAELDTAEQKWRRRCG
jgi:hypothetical protein